MYRSNHIEKEPYGPTAAPVIVPAFHTPIRSIALQILSTVAITAVLTASAFLVKHPTIRATIIMAGCLVFIVKLHRAHTYIQAAEARMQETSTRTQQAEDTTNRQSQQPTQLDKEKIEALEEANKALQEALQTAQIAIETRKEALENLEKAHTNIADLRSQITKLNAQIDNLTHQRGRSDALIESNIARGRLPHLKPFTELDLASL